MKLALGTVQLGLDYGVSNQSGQVSKYTANKILDLASQLNIQLLDTAKAYGNSESILGEFAAKNSKVITKLPPDCKSYDQVINYCKDSLKALNNKKIYALMLHDADILEKKSDELKRALTYLKKNGYIEKYGASLYSPSQVTYFDTFKPDIIQIPLNLLDQRFLQNQLLQTLKAQGVEIHVRSVFLQGLLLMDTSKLPTYFKKFQSLKKLENKIKDLKISKLEACIGFLKSINQIDALVLGCCTESQLLELNEVFLNAEPFYGKEYACLNDNLIMPNLWPKES